MGPERCESSSAPRLRGRGKQGQGVEWASSPAALLCVKRLVSRNRAPAEMWHAWQRSVVYHGLEDQDEDENENECPIAQTDLRNLRPVRSRYNVFGTSRSW
jgi:hypothetical protein